MRRLAQLPLIVLLLGATGVAMLLPAGHALALGAADEAGVFALVAALVVLAAALLGLATMRVRPLGGGRGQFLAMVAAYALLPPVMALPLAAAAPDLGFGAAWYEMVSSFTTTGASLLPGRDDIGATLHLWNALAGWLGGLFVLLAAIAILAPLNLGGLEVEAPRPVGRGALLATAIHDEADPVRRLGVNLRVLLPVYTGLTVLLWVGLMLAGEEAFVALCHAMGILSTSGISPVGGIEGAGAGRLGEALMLAFLVFAVTRRSLPGVAQPDGRRAFHRDPELRLAIVLVVGLAAPLTLWQTWGSEAGAAPGGQALLDGLRALWGNLFTLASFLTTTGYISADRAVDEVATPVLLLAGLALIGGGVATTAGGIKLLRVLALVRQGQHEMHKLLHPSLVAGGGPRARHLRGDGAYLAWLAFMMFVLSIAVGAGALALAGLEFEAALILTLAAISTTGPLVHAAGSAAPDLAALDGAQRGVAMVAMILGRLELLAVVTLILPSAWRR